MKVFVSWKELIWTCPFFVCVDIFFKKELQPFYSFSLEAKEQILANLANFAYEPRNMEALRMLQVIELFLDMLTEENENFVEFGIGEYN